MPLKRHDAARYPLSLTARAWDRIWTAATAAATPTKPDSLAARLDGLRRHTEEGNVIELTTHDVQHLLRCVPEFETAKVRVAELIGENTRLRTALAKAQVRRFWAYLSAASLLVGLLIATAQGKLSWHLF